MRKKRQLLSTTPAPDAPSGKKPATQSATATQVSDKSVGAAPARRSPWSDALGLTGIRAVQIIAIVLLAAGVLVGIQYLTVVVIPVILALIFSSALAPVMTWLRKKGVPSIWATLLALFGIVAVLSLLVWFIIVAVRGQWRDLAGQATDGFNQVMAWVQTLPIAPDEKQLQEWIDTLMGFLTSAQFGSGALAGVGAAASFITGLVLTIVVLFYFLKDGPAIWRFLQRPFNGDDRARMQRIGNKTVQTLGSYVRGTASVAAVDAIGIGIGLWICGVPLALPLAVLVFVLAFIPIVGATAAGIIAALVALVANGPVVAVIVVGIVILVNQLEGNFLQPVLMGRSLKLHSLVILIALTIGTVLGGIVGAVLAVPITAVAWGIIQVWDGPNKAARWARPHTDDPVS